MAAYKKRTYRRKKTTWYNKKYSTMDLAKKAWVATKYLKGLVNSEMLHKDNVLTLGANQSQIFPMVNMAQGDSDAGRTGNSLLLRNIYIRGSLQINAATTANTRTTVCLIKDKQQVSDTTPTITDIFASNNNPDTLMNLNNAGRFKVLWRKNYVMTPVAGGRNVHELTKYWKIYDHVRFNGTSGSDIQKNGYYLVVITSEGVNFPTIEFQSRVGYHDN